MKQIIPHIFLILFLLCSSANSGRFMHSHLEQSTSFAPPPEVSIATGLDTLGHRKCTFNDYQPYTRVDTTKHFKILYSTKGAHRIYGKDSIEREKYLTRIKENLEIAKGFFENVIGLTNSNGMPSAFYSNNDYPDKYTIEVLDISQIKNDTLNILQERNIFGHFGLVTTPNQARDTSILFLENDFLFKQAQSQGRLDFLTEGLDTVCYFVDGLDTIQTDKGDSTTNFHLRWDEGLDITIAHELYHSYQLHYDDFKDYHFWFEASATAMEDYLFSHNNDYMVWLPNFFQGTNKSFESYSYSFSIFTRYIIDRFGGGIEKKLWENFSNDSLSATDNLKNTLVDEYNVVWADFYSDFIAILLNSGSNYVDYDSAIIKEDQPHWPDFKSKAVVGDTLTNYELSRDGFLIFDIRDLVEENRLVLDLEDTTGMNIYMVELADSAILKKRVETDSVYTFVDFKDQEHLVIYNEGNEQNLKVYSDFKTVEILSEEIKNIYPNPYSISSPTGMCFHYDLFNDNEVIQIFNSNFVVVETLNKANEINNEICWFGRNRNGEKIKPGVYFYKTKLSGQKGKIIVLD